MVYNNWLDPEIEMIQAAIMDFVDRIDDGEIESLALRKPTKMTGYYDDVMALFDEMLEEYQIEYTEDIYFDFCEELERKLDYYIINNF